MRPWIVHISRIAAGYVLGAFAAAIGFGLYRVLVIGQPSDIALTGRSLLDLADPELIDLALAIMAATILPAGIAVYFCERTRLRLSAVYAVGGAIILAVPFLMILSIAGRWNGDSVMSLLLSGALAGWVYWLVAGRFAGFGKVVSTPGKTRPANVEPLQ